MKPTSPAPALSELNTALGASAPVWQQLCTTLAQDFPDLRQEWKPTKLEFGRVCLLKQKDRTLIYLIPRRGDFEASIVLGERAVGLALADDLPEAIRRLIAEARPYAEGRGIRFPVTDHAQIGVIRRLVACKSTPR